MYIPEQHIDLFDAYLQKTLSEKELKEFEARLVYDNEFKAHFESFQQVEKEIGQHFRNKMKDKFKQLDVRLDKEPRVIPITKRNKFKKLYLSIGSVAAVLIIGIIIHFSTQNTTQNLVAQYWPVEEGLPVRMSSKNKFDAAMNAFKQEQWTKAEMLFEQIDSDTSTYFIGIINYEQKEYKNAVTSFEGISESSVWHQEAEFRLALLYLQLEEFEEAKVVLKSISASDSLFSKESGRILEKL